MDKPSLDEIRLTQSVLGPLRYLPASLWLDALREAVYHWNPNLVGKLDSADEVEVALWPAHPLPATRNVGRIAKRRGGAKLDKGVMTPDLVIQTRAWTLVVSASADESTAADQVLQDFLIAQTIRDDEAGYLLHVNGLSSRQLLAGVRFQARGTIGPVKPGDPLSKYIAARCEKIDGLHADEAAVESRLAWLSWQTLHNLLSGITVAEGSAEYVAVAQRLLGDAVETLVLAGYESIESDIVESLASLVIDPDAIPQLALLEPVAEAVSRAKKRVAKQDEAEDKKQAGAAAKKAAAAKKKAEAKEAEAKKKAETKEAEPASEAEAPSAVPAVEPAAETQGERPAVALAASAEGITAYLAGVTVDPTRIPERFVP